MQSRVESHKNSWTYDFIEISRGLSILAKVKNELLYLSPPTMK